MKIPQGGIAFFDSGIGGLTVMNACQRILPNEIFYYYGDNVHAPYGNLPPKRIRRFVFSAFRKLRRLRVKAVVLACNTATAVCINELRKKYSFPIIGTEPAVFPAAKQGGEVWVLSTRATYNNIRFKELCARAERYYPQSKIRGVPCDGLAGAIEKHIEEEGYDYTSYLPKGAPSSIVLGCTHYPYIAKQIKEFYHCPVYDGSDGIAKHLRKMVSEGTKLDKKASMGQKTAILLGRLTTSLFFDKKALVFRRKSKKKQKRKKLSKNLFFLGKQRDLNERIYERMFAFIQSG